MSARLFMLLLGLAAVGWGAATLPVFWHQSTIERTATHIVDRDAFKPEALVLLMPAVEAAEQAVLCRPEALRSAALIRLRLAEGAMAAGERTTIDGQLASLEDSIRRSLTCSPADPFLWMALAWLDGAREGFRPEQLQYLRLSYLLGPNEGWIAVKRNRLALSTYERLPPDLADAAMVEFARMLDSWCYPETIAIFTGPGWPIRDKLLMRTQDVSVRQREAFAKELYAQGYDVVVPGIASREWRPWN
jgi:hypothetical protein